MELCMVAAAAFLGAMLVALLGWLESGETFVFRKFAASICRGLIASVAFAAGYSYAKNISAIDVVSAFLAGAGVDAVLKRAGGTVRALGKKG